MILSMSGQAWLFLSTVLVGAVIGLFYDFFRIFRKTAAHSAWAVQLEDLFFWITATVGTFYFMLTRNYGEIRLFALLGVALGITLYFATVSRLVVKICVVVVTFLKRVIASAVRIILLPLRLIFTWIGPPIKSFAGKRRKDLRGLARYGKIQMKKTARSWFILRKKV
ncbi:MAG: spore cortex biosynthesis protein YabQ [Defluviitaleaceae bacterium]|nr:spore cortex biosynthesis protein YabQ [Defluviitaleaceae bacterium]